MKQKERDSEKKCMIMNHPAFQKGICFFLQKVRKVMYQGNNPRKCEKFDKLVQNSWYFFPIVNWLLFWFFLLLFKLQIHWFFNHILYSLIFFSHYLQCSGVRNWILTTSFIYVVSSVFWVLSEFFYFWISREGEFSWLLDYLICFLTIYNLRMSYFPIKWSIFDTFFKNIPR